MRKRARQGMDIFVPPVDEAGRWPARNGMDVGTEAVGLGWYDAGLRPAIRDRRGLFRFRGLSLGEGAFHGGFDGKATQIFGEDFPVWSDQKDGGEASGRLRAKGENQERERSGLTNRRGNP